ncbi:hypothetical protein F1559_000948 [Cyanidiococcus yangmingshanensis]|uniref:gamma-glutamylcyclotransferase n=1 Tax=Cyanidiococcus yangmingshanensis TaxID=2690220 RepID=A0A7J7IJQ2_9RHOD|nr:hypothetical protein F1559_000948 [Cyanidiococcus yangmingshanensis]
MVPAKHVAGSSDIVYNFAIGSNVNTDRLRSRARWLGTGASIEYLSAEPAVLRGYRVVFNTPGFPPAEPAFCSVRACECGAGARCPSQVHGVLYAFDRASYELLWVTEGGLGGREATSSYVERPVLVETYAQPGVQREALIFETRPNRTVERWYRDWLRSGSYRRRWLASEFSCVSTSAMHVLERELAAQRSVSTRARIKALPARAVDGSKSPPLWYAQHAHVLETIEALPEDHPDRLALELERVLIRPSMRYLGLIRDGAMHSGLDADYRQLLETYMVHWRVSCPCAGRPQPLQAWITAFVNMSTPGFFRLMWWAHTMHRGHLLRLLHGIWDRLFRRVLSFLAMERELHAIRLAQRARTGVPTLQRLLHWGMVWLCSFAILFWAAPAAFMGLLSGTGNFFHVRSSASRSCASPAGRRQMHVAN